VPSFPDPTIPTTIAEDKGIFYILDEKFIDNISELPYSSGTPEVNWQASGYIHAWIDITGFKQMSRDNGIDYIPGGPEDFAIVQYDAKAKFGSVTKLLKSVQVSQENNFTIATLAVDLYWKSTICYENSCWKCRIMIKHSSRIQSSLQNISPLQEDLWANLTNIIILYMKISASALRISQD